MIAYLQSLILNSPNQLISYAEYIDAVLYHPEIGYYMNNQQKIGREGDFITTSNISDIYGRLMAKWFSEVWVRKGLPSVFCEIGAGNGRFAYSFLKTWYETMEMPLQYIIVETSPYHRSLQAELIKEPFPAVIQAESIRDLESVEGMVFSNELFDALPVHVVEKMNGELFEIMIGISNGELAEEKVPLTNNEIISYLEEAGLHLNEKQRIEVPLAMEQVLLDISRVLKKGIVLTADYGYSNEEWMELQRAEGSLRGYFQHQLIPNVLKYPGQMDITSHIHFDSLIQKGRKADLHLVAKLRQDEFLLKAGILHELEGHHDPNPFSEVSRRNRAIRSLILPGGMSSYFHMVIQQKALDFTVDDLFKE